MRIVFFICTFALVFIRFRYKVDLTKYIEQHEFAFDKVFDENTTHIDLYQDAVSPLVKAAFTGTKITVFAYGQTGSGKTYTMMGPPNQELEDHGYTTGIFLQAVQDIFNIFKHNKKAPFALIVSFYEIYCGKLFDLLNDRNILFAREDAHQVLFKAN